MRLSKRTNTIILWLISLGLLVGMIITFTPSLGNLFGNRSNGADGSGDAILVNGQVITELEVARARQNRLYQAVTEGEVGEDLQLLLADTLIRQELLEQAASRIQVSNGDVRREVNDFRASQGVAGSRNDQAYLQLIRGSGFDDQSFRTYIRRQLRLERYQEELASEVTVTDGEVEGYYLGNQGAYRSEERIVARMIEVEDEGLAASLRERALAGEDFAVLAQENSLERADRGGALGAPQGSSEPQPVGRAALPIAAANAAFGLQGPGLTEVVSSGDRFFLVSVTSYVPSETRPLDEVRDQVREDALEAKRATALQQRLERLMDEAEVVIPATSSVTYEDSAVARVGETPILRSELARAIYGNSQVQQFLGPDSASLITQFFKPSILDQLIQQELAFQGARELGPDFIGSRDRVAQSALAYVSRDVTASEEEISTYYQENLDRFTTPASAEVTRVTFGDEEGAAGFRAALLGGTELEAAAASFEGVAEDLGVVGEGDLADELDAILFATDAFEVLPDGDREVSDVLVLTLPAEEVAPEEPEAPAEEATAEGEPAEDAPAEDAPGEEEPAGDTPENETAPEAADEPAPEAAAVEPESTGPEAGPDAQADEGAGEAGAGEAAAPEGADAALPEVPGRLEYVVLVAARTPEQVQSLEEVRLQVEQAVLTQKRGRVQGEWLDGLRERIPVVNLLTSATAPFQVPEGTADGGAEGADDAAVESAVTADIADSATLEEAESLAAELTGRLRSLATRDDLSVEEQSELEQVQANLEKVQGEVAAFSGALGTYTVKQGDTLSDIAGSYFEDSGRWQAILDANRYLIDDENLIFPGFVLLIPDVEGAAVD